MVDGLVEFDEDNWWVLQNVRVTELFYSLSEGRCETVLAFGGKREDCSKNYRSSEKISVQLRKDLAFMEFALDALETYFLRATKRKCCPKSNYGLEKSFALFRGMKL